MFGSLVVIQPTPHEGGSLLFRHHGQEWTYDSAKAVSFESTPRAAFVAFFSDVEHEVSTVISGYRITLTYNLYFTKDADPPAALFSESDNLNNSDDRLKTSLAALLEDKTLLRQGGFIGFGLAHKYPINPRSTQLEDLVKFLKGTDAALHRVCMSLSLECSLKYCYMEENMGSIACLLDHPASMEGRSIDDEMSNVVRYLSEYIYGSLVVYERGHDFQEWDGYNQDRLKEIIWVKPSGDTNQFRENYLLQYCGNEASNHWGALLELVSQPLNLDWCP